MRPKHIPLRTCIGCRQSKPKRELVRIVHGPEGRVAVDISGKQPGRGAYVCETVECLSAAFKRGHLEKSLRTGISKDALDSLAAELKALVESATT